ncbi:MAG: prepilin-type N-terminal cleavage/methylation domain-containing protein [Kordiimonas sp.]
MRIVRSEAGFSLVEMMMVVAIIGLMTSAIVLYMPSKNDTLKDTLARTESAFIALSRHSVMTGRVYGARFSVQGFSPYVLSDDGWVLEEGLLKAEATNWQPVSLSALSVEGSDINLNEETVGPHVWFLPTSEATSFRLNMIADTGAATLEMSGVGKIKVAFDG